MADLSATSKLLLDDYQSVKIRTDLRNINTRIIETADKLAARLTEVETGLETPVNPVAAAAVAQLSEQALAAAEQSGYERGLRAAASVIKPTSGRPAATPLKRVDPAS